MQHNPRKPRLAASISGSLALGVVVALCAIPANGVLTTYVNNLSTNSSDWTAGATGTGGAIQTIDWEAHPLGALNPTFYQGSLGVTITPTGAYGPIDNQLAPSGSVTSPQSTGEGLATASHFLVDYETPSSLLFDFTQPVGGFGLKIIDLYNPNGIHPYTLSYYDAPGGTGTLLGSITTPGYCFQLNYIYFFGAVSSQFDIQSVVLSDQQVQPSGDGVNIDDIRFVTVPEPSCALGAIALSALGAIRRRR